MILHSRLETKRLEVRPFAGSDILRLVDLFADPEVRQFVDDGMALSLEHAREWVDKSRTNLERFGYGTGAVAERATGEMIGWAGIARPENGDEEIIYGVARDRWGMGFGQELVLALVEFAGRVGLKRIVATVHPANTRSIALLQQQAFTARLIADPVGGDYLLFERGVPSSNDGE